MKKEVDSLQKKLQLAIDNLELSTHDVCCVLCLEKGELMAYTKALEAVRDIAKEIQPQTDIDYWQKFLYETFGNRRIADTQDEDTLVIALAKEAGKTMKLLVSTEAKQ